MDLNRNIWLLYGGCLLLLAAGSYGQSSLSGKITDKQTGEPVPFANVFFAHTTLGNSSLVDGTFEINRIPNGRYDLVVEVVGYQTHKQPMDFLDGSYKVEIVLAQDIVRLDSITVVADQADKKYFQLFSTFFLGTGGNAKKCTIQNPEVLHFYFDKQKNYLHVSARKPVRISNPVLGYTVHYSLERFGLDFSSGAKVMQGSPRFEEMPARSRKDSVSRQKKRKKAYLGSLFHFMRALHNHSTDREKFEILIADSVEVVGSPVKEERLRPFPYGDLLSGDKIKHLKFTGLLKVEYRDKESWEYPGRGYSRYKSNPHGHQQTYLMLRDPSLDIYENGYFSDQMSVYLTGYLVWKETICNMVPLGHEPAIAKRPKGKTRGK